MTKRKLIHELRSGSERVPGDIIVWVGRLFILIARHPGRIVWMSDEGEMNLNFAHDEQSYKVIVRGPK